LNSFSYQQSLQPFDVFNLNRRNPGLTLPATPRKSNGKVSGYPTSFYAQWRLRNGSVFMLQEGEEIPPEQLLQSVWQHQRLLRAQLKTLDGQRVRVLHPGFLSREGGPDFRGAVIQIGDALPLTGDVEVDLHIHGWRAHGHDRNPAFEKVILHVVWDGEKSASRISPAKNSPAGLQNPPAALALRTVLDSPITELGLWLNSEAAEKLPETFRGQCCAPLRELSADKLIELLRQAAQIRFRAKAAQISARARAEGWEQSLWEGIFRALGYKHNAWPMQCLAEHRARWLGRKPSSFALQSRLLGVGNLLPTELTRAQATADSYLRRVWDQWWREREEFSDCALPHELWHFHGQRPANHPQRRLALASHWLADDRLVSKLEHWCAADLADEKLLSSLHDILQIGPDEFWSWHWTLRSPRLKKSQPLLGAARVTDLAVNVILPWLWSRAVEGKNKKVQGLMEHRYHAWPAAEDNAVLRLARERLLGSASKHLFQGAALQQGLIQIVRDFCDHSNAVCDKCGFPGLVRGFNQ
jgi:hypothetical protein